jgi:hypothetical protein
MNSRRTTALVSAFVAMLAALALAAPAAFAREPVPPYERFAGCPSPEENPTIIVCIHSIVESGHFQMGSKDVPITNPIPMTGGIDEAGRLFANSHGGLTPVKQQVPGGVIGLTGLDWLINFLNIEQLKLFAVTELVGQPVVGEGTLSLPIRVHLINSVLGNSCYVGSPSSPIKLEMTTGTTSPPPPNKPISGKPLVLSVGETAIEGKGTYVDNSFAAPGANGCVLTLFGFIPISINGLVNSQSGLPSPAGTNETIQNIKLELVGPGAVYP